MSKDLVLGYLIAMNAPQRIMTAFEVCTQAATPKGIDPRTIEIRTLPIGNRAAYVLTQNKITTAHHYLHFTNGELLKLPNFGRKSLNEVNTALLNLGVNTEKRGCGTIRWMPGQGYVTTLPMEDI